MVEAFIVIAWILGVVLGVMWFFLPWIIISKLDEVVDELRKLNNRANR